MRIYRHRNSQFHSTLHFLFQQLLRRLRLRFGNFKYQLVMHLQYQPRLGHFLTQSAVYLHHRQLDYIGGSSLILQVLCMVILAPLFEELVFRRTLIDRMRPYGEKLAVVTTAAMFALFHGNLSQMFYAFTLGLVFGYVYVRTGKLRYTVGLHMLINLLGGVVGPLLTDWAGDALDLEDVSRLAEAELTPGALALGAYGLLMIVAAIAGLVLLIARAKRVRFQPAPLELPRGKRFSTAWLNPGMLLFTAACLLMVVSTFLTL